MSEAIQKTGLTRDQIELVKQTVARGATDLELKMFLYQCERTGLDPLSRQIHFVKRGEHGTIQTGIDGYRVLADRTGECAGIEDAVFVDDPGHSWPMSATVTVYRLVQGQKCSFTATARWSEYFPSNEKQQFFWKKMPYGQLAKCAESLALRKAFPAQLSGVYTNEEMQQAGPEIVQVGEKTVEANTLEASRAVADEKIAKLKAEMEARRAEKPITTTDGPFITDKQNGRLYAIWKSHGWDDQEAHARIKEGWGLTSTKDIKKGKQYEQICEYFEQTAAPKLELPKDDDWFGVEPADSSDEPHV